MARDGRQSSTRGPSGTGPTGLPAWQDGAVTEQAARYDRIATGYARWWAPVLVPQAAALLEWLEPAVAAGARRLIDIGTGSGTLALAAIRRWPTVEVVGIDASSGMEALATIEADRRLSPADRGRFETRVAFADGLPFPDGSFDAAMSSFVFQLVPNRARAIREAHRVLRPGGLLAYVSWLRDDRIFRPDVEFDAVLDEIGIGAREEGDDRPGDIPSMEAAGTQMRRAGFRDVRAERAMLEHPFSVEGYIRFMAEFDEEDLVASLETEERERLLRRLRSRLKALPADALVLRLPVVSVSGVRS
jgi:ubiquinone/menaquinone biosynthesis C-methylase UbiE